MNKKNVVILATLLSGVVILWILDIIKGSVEDQQLSLFKPLEMLWSYGVVTVLGVLFSLKWLELTKAPVNYYLWDKVLGKVVGITVSILGFPGIMILLNVYKVSDTFVLAILGLYLIVASILSIILWKLVAPDLIRLCALGDAK